MSGLVAYSDDDDDDDDDDVPLAGGPALLPAAISMPNVAAAIAGSDVEDSDDDDDKYSSDSRCARSLAQFAAEFPPLLSIFFLDEDKAEDEENSFPCGCTFAKSN